MRKLCLALTFLLCLPGVLTAESPDLLRPFLKTYCVQCHGPQKQNQYLIENFFTREKWMDPLKTSIRIWEATRFVYP